jgi:hypothetical protein
MSASLTLYGEQELVRKCVGHKSFRSEDEALIRVAQHGRWYDCLRCRKGDEPMGAFFCFACGHWHVGHSRRNRRQGQ